MTIRIVLADDHAVVRTGLRTLLAEESDIVVVGEAATGDAAQQLCVDLHPDILLLDLSMPGSSALETAAFLHANSPETRIVMLTAYHDGTAVRELVRAGVGGYVLKDDEPEAVAEAIAQVAGGGTWFSPQVMEELVRGSRGVDNGGHLPDLTDREWELVSLIKRGWDNKHIAAELGLGEQTVRNYFSTIYAKIGVTSRTEAVIWAREHSFRQS